jgi:hypothetical protein
MNAHKNLKKYFLKKKIQKINKFSFMIVHMNVHKNKNMLGRILKDPEHSKTFEIKCERPGIQDVNVFNSNLFNNDISSLIQCLSTQEG